MTAFNEVVKDINVKGNYLAAIRNRGKDVLIKDLESAIEMMIEAVSENEKLVAENAALMSMIPADLWPKEECPSTGAICNVAPSDLTPATDAAIAEIGAKPMDTLAGVAETMLVKFSNAGVSHCPEAVGWRLVKRQAESEAANLRAGRKG